MTPVTRWLLYVAASYVALLASVYSLASASTWNAAPSPVALDGGSPPGSTHRGRGRRRSSRRPVEAVPVAVGGSTAGLGNLLTDTEGSVSLVDARGGQRILDVPYESAVPGQSLLLSPDGTMVAYPHDAVEPSITPSERPSPSAHSATGMVPASCLCPRPRRPRDTARLVARPVPPRGLHLRLVCRRPFRSAPARTRCCCPIRPAWAPRRGPRSWPRSRPTARSPSSSARNLAGQAKLRGEAGAWSPNCFTLPAGRRLAGKGAFTPDGRSLAVVSDAGRDSRITFVSATESALLRA